jgi:uncharacterized lipoprotein YmbA
MTVRTPDYLSRAAETEPCRSRAIGRHVACIGAPPGGDDPRTSFDATVAVDVVRFEVDANDGSARLVARWTLGGGRNASTTVRESDLRAPIAGKSTNDAVAALSEVLAVLGHELASAIRVATAGR